MDSLTSYAPAVSGVTPAEQWMAALDKRTIDGPEPWALHVLGVHHDDRDVWMQVAPAGDAAASIVLRVSPRATPAHVLASLRRDLPDGENYPRVLDVMRLI